MEKNFLMPDTQNIRKSIKDIDDSYSHFWDILSELLQNAVDAIRHLNIATDTNKKGTIGITIDCIKRSISVYDSGIGFEAENLSSLLRPFSTNKGDYFALNGEKGVGLDFVIFQSNKFSLKTKYYLEPNISLVTISQARNWKNSDSADLITLNQDSVDNTENFNGTEITIEDIINDNLFQLTFDQFKFILRTKTAIGNVLSIFNNSTENIDVWLKLIDISGNKYDEKIPYKYWLPTENLNKKTLLDIKDFNEWEEKEKPNNEEKIKKVANKILIKSDSFDHKGRQLKYWACMMPYREKWEEIAYFNKLISQNQIENLSKSEKSDFLDEHQFTIHTSGIFSSSKGMPTGILTNPSQYVGNAVFLPLFFIIFEDPTLNFDIGRKSLHHSIIKIYEKYSKDIFNELSGIKVVYKATEPKEYDSELDEEQLIKDINNLPQIDSRYKKYINFDYSPVKQEASIVSIFYQLVGRDLLLEEKFKLFKNLSIIATHYKDRYDLVVRIKDKIKFVEFKSKLNNIISDFENYNKFFDELNYIVCWNVDDIDKKDLKSKFNLTVEECYDDDWSNDNPIQAVTHKIMMKASHSIYVIDLKYLLDKLSSNN